MVSHARRVSGLPLPPYSYVPSAYPHPISDPRGHGCAGPTPADRLPPAAELLRDQTFLWACDLFDAGYYWEAHEAWEALWKLALPVDSSAADFLKALIKLAAAAVKAREGRIAGVRRHAQRAEELLRLVQRKATSAQQDVWHLDQLMRLAAEIQQHAPDLLQQAAIDNQQGLLARLPF